MSMIKKTMLMSFAVLSFEAFAYTGVYTVPGGQTYLVKDIELEFEEGKVDIITYKLPKALFVHEYSGELEWDSKDLYESADADAHCFKSKKALTCSLQFSDEFKSLVQEVAEETTKFIDENFTTEQGAELIFSLKKFTSEGIGVLTIFLE